jgi:hypothetical protein
MRLCLAVKVYKWPPSPPLVQKARDYAEPTRIDAYQRDRIHPGSSPVQETFIACLDFSAPGVLTPAEREIISQGLNALLRERYRAYEIAVKVALSRGHTQPSVSDFGLPDILRLSRLI